jgi:peroxiredoxin Q/BCP
MADAGVADPIVWPPKEMNRMMPVSVQGPLDSFTRAFRLENMLHLTPNCSDDRASLVEVGEPSPDFEVLGTDGRRITLDALRGRPAILRFSRAVSETMVCPICMPAIEDLKTTYPAFEAAGIPLVMVFSTSEAQTAGIAERLGLDYPLYTDPAWDVFGAYGTGHMLGAPKQAWVVLDADGVVRWTWRTGQGGSQIGPMPMPMEVLATARRVLGLDDTA